MPEYRTSDFSRCADCGDYFPTDLMVDIDGDGAFYCADDAEALWQALATYAAVSVAETA